MNSLRPKIYGRWVHSFEEDEMDLAVYRPPDYPFPRARGRAAIEFRPDGTFVDWQIGRGDANEAVTGTWHEEGPTRVGVSFEGTGRPSRTLEIVQCDAAVLKVRTE